MDGYLYTHTQYTGSNSTADSRGLISVGASSNSGKIFCFKFWREISCRLSPSLLFPVQADSLGWLPSTLWQTWETERRGKRRETGRPFSPICPTGLWWGLGQVMEKPALPAIFTEKGADQQEPRRTLLHPVMTNENCFPLLLHQVEREEPPNKNVPKKSLR